MPTMTSGQAVGKDRVLWSPVNIYICMIYIYRMYGPLRSSAFGFQMSHEMFMQRAELLFVWKGMAGIGESTATGCPDGRPTADVDGLRHN